MVSEIFKTLVIGWARHASRSALESGISNFNLPCKTTCQYLSYQKMLEQSFQWLVRYSPDTISVV